MSGNIKGIFYGVSTGPGDPELMTVKAVRILKEADVIAAARVMGKQETALEIAKQAVWLGEVVKDGLLENEAYGYFTTVIVKE